MRGELLLVCLIATSGCDLLFNLDHVGQSNGDGGTTLDAPADTPAGAHRVVFATSQLINGAMGGLPGADAFCNMLAVKATLPGTFKAWLSTAAESPATRMTHADVPYVLANGTLIARNWADLTDGMLLVPINIDEAAHGALGNYVCSNGEVWSDTDVQGNLSGNSCTDWTSTNAVGDAAHLTQADAGWTVATCPQVSCSTPLPIYCFEQ